MMKTPYDRRFVKGETTTLKAGVVTVAECIRYIESCGWKLQNRARGYYHFLNPEAANPSHQNMRFSLKELRESYRNGW